MTDHDLMDAVDDAIGQDFAVDLHFHTRDLTPETRAVIGWQLRQLWPRPLDEDMPDEEVDDDAEPIWTPEARLRIRILEAVAAQLGPDADHDTPGLLRAARDEVGMAALMELLPDLAKWLRLPPAGANIIRWDPDIKAPAWWQLVGEVLTTAASTA